MSRPAPPNYLTLFIVTKNKLYNVYIIIYIYIYTTILPLCCTDGRYFYHISGTALFSGTN